MFDSFEGYQWFTLVNLIDGTVISILTKGTIITIFLGLSINTEQQQRKLFATPVRIF